MSSLIVIHLRCASSGEFRPAVGELGHDIEMTARDEILAAVPIVRATDGTFTVEQIVTQLNRSGSAYAKSTIRTLIAARMCSNAPNNHLSTFDDLVRAGKVLYVGVSEWTAGQIEDAVRISAEMGFDRIVSNQPQYSALWRVIEAEVEPGCRQNVIGQLVWAPVAQGAKTVTPSLGPCGAGGRGGLDPPKTLRRRGEGRSRPAQDPAV